MKRLFAETNGFSTVLFVDKNNKAYVVDEKSFEEPLTLAVAKKSDYENLDGCETAQECLECMGFGDVIEFNEDEFEKITEF